MNGVLRSMARNLDKVKYPDPKEMPVPYLSVTYSMPEWILNSWLRLYDFETVETICQGIHKDHVTYGALQPQQGFQEGYHGESEEPGRYRDGASVP